MTSGNGHASEAAPHASDYSSQQDSGLIALCLLAKQEHRAASPQHLAHQMALKAPVEEEDILRAAQLLGLQAKAMTVKRLHGLQRAIACLTDGSYRLVDGQGDAGHYRILNPLTMVVEHVSWEELLALTRGRLIFVKRNPEASKDNSSAFGLGWFLPTLWRYRRPIGHVLVASLFIQAFALVTPLFFQVVIDKVLAHHSYETLVVLVIGLIGLGAFDVILQYLRTYVLSHTSNRIDVELGQRLFRHLLSLPLDYFDTRATGQTVARVRELETIREFLTGQGLFSGIDLLFTFVFIFVLFLYSSTLAWIVVASIPVYILITLLVRPFLRRRIDEMFNRGAYSQQLLVESVVGMQTLKASAVEPVVAKEWETRLASYVKSSFATTMLSAKGQNAIQYVSKLTTAGILYFGAKAVIQGDMTVGALVAFNMIAGQVAQPILRLSQFWQDFQQVQISITRLGDILNETPEPVPTESVSMSPPVGAIDIHKVTFRYQHDGPEILKDIELSIASGEVVGIVGASGSGKSTLAKLIQRFHMPSKGQVFLDGQDIAHVDPTWLRTHIGVVLQENLLFHSSVHDNIALADPSLSREAVIQLAKLSGADVFIRELPHGYDTIIEERGANLSGGQRQRLAIARALATDPPMLIFDEATSALDYESEHLIMQNMQEIVRDRTVLIIAHRLATVRQCDRIVVMEDGNIVEVGSHDELIEKPEGRYACLWALQTGASESEV
ncbi:type I secretion system permease/ATPase [Halomonas eurihalina]|uniref:Type I secretion system permease/ATPase n=1 Tax=Halomonas eurihalina TaxID=42566 RepID=A0A5D9D989_HALER|nr:type I secretion system permease/ATPase [Halomonas eurihalina]MDR5859690.1 type I secretion system permease/ATPase [Halomonas eurihalina]TZG39145.1 type I secretion system permease/ATPase [Halomonas eurihalina]